RLLARLLGYWALFNTNQGLAVRAIQDIDPACAAGFGNALARLTIDHRVKEHHRAGGIVVPDVVVHLLEVPGVSTGLGMHRHDRGAEEVVALTRRPVVIWPAVASGEVDEPEFRIKGWRVPDRRSTTRGMVCARWPGVTANLARPWQRIRSPQD